jgi:hypothetical protein
VTVFAIARFPFRAAEDAGSLEKLSFLSDDGFDRALLRRRSGIGPTDGRDRPDVRYGLVAFLCFQATILNYVINSQLKIAKFSTYRAMKAVHWQRVVVGSSVPGYLEVRGAIVRAAAFACGRTDGVQVLFQAHECLKSFPGQREATHRFTAVVPNDRPTA